MNQLRIIAGKHRSRKITFATVEGLRPTHNRIRETIFNWLQPVIENSDCLDAFAGSGAMGFEAISRGTKHTTFIDISQKVIDHLQRNAFQLQTTNADYYCCDFMQHNPIQNKQFDIVFLDPPFQKNILLEACHLLVSRDLLKPNAFITLEFSKNSIDINKLPKQWVIKKQKNTQTLSYMLCQFNP